MIIGTPHDNKNPSGYPSTFGTGPTYPMDYMDPFDGPAPFPPPYRSPYHHNGLAPSPPPPLGPPPHYFSSPHTRGPHAGLGRPPPPPHSPHGFPYFNTSSHTHSTQSPPFNLDSDFDLAAFENLSLMPQHPSPMRPMHHGHGFGLSSFSPMHHGRSPGMMRSPHVQSPPVPPFEFPFAHHGHGHGHRHRHRHSYSSYHPHPHSHTHPHQPDHHYPRHGSQTQSQTSAQSSHLHRVYSNSSVPHVYNADTVTDKNPLNAPEYIQPIDVRSNGPGSVPGSRSVSQHGSEGLHRDNSLDPADVGIHAEGYNLSGSDASFQHDGRRRGPQGYGYGYRSRDIGGLDGHGLGHERGRDRDSIFSDAHPHHSYSQHYHGPHHQRPPFGQFGHDRHSRHDHHSWSSSSSDYAHVNRHHHLHGGPHSHGHFPPHHQHSHQHPHHLHGHLPGSLHLHPPPPFDTKTDVDDEEWEDVTGGLESDFESVSSISESGSEYGREHGHGHRGRSRSRSRGRSQSRGQSRDRGINGEKRDAELYAQAHVDADGNPNHMHNRDRSRSRNRNRNRSHSRSRDEFDAGRVNLADNNDNIGTGAGIGRVDVEDVQGSHRHDEDDGVVSDTQSHYSRSGSRARSHSRSRGEDGYGGLNGVGQDYHDGRLGGGYGYGYEYGMGGGRERERERGFSAGGLGGGGPGFGFGFGFGFDHHGHHGHHSRRHGHGHPHHGHGPGFSGFEGLSRESSREFRSMSGSGPEHMHGSDLRGRGGPGSSRDRSHFGPPHGHDYRHSVGPGDVPGIERENLNAGGAIPVAA